WRPAGYAKPALSAWGGELVTTGWLLRAQALQGAIDYLEALHVVGPGAAERILDVRPGRIGPGPEQEHPRRTAARECPSLPQFEHEDPVLGLEVQLVDVAGSVPPQIDAARRRGLHRHGAGRTARTGVDAGRCDALEAELARSCRGIGAAGDIPFADEDGTPAGYRRHRCGVVAQKPSGQQCQRLAMPDQPQPAAVPARHHCVYRRHSRNASLLLSVLFFLHRR